MQVPRDPSWVVGVDIGGSQIVGVLLRSGSVIDRLKRPTNSGSGYDKVLHRVAAMVRTLCRRQALPLAELQFVGVGLAGTVSAGEVSYAVNLSWSSVPFARDLSTLLEAVPVQVHNDVNCAALAEGRYGAADAASSAFCWFVGTGLGGAYWQGGRVWTGASGAAGEVGHVQVPGLPGLCSCGQRGCLETVLRKSQLPKRLSPSELSSQKALVEFCQQLVWGMDLVACLLHPEIMVLGGGVISSLGARVLECVERQRGSPPRMLYGVRLSKLRGDAVAIGAALWRDQSNTPPPPDPPIVSCPKR